MGSAQILFFFSAVGVFNGLLLFLFFLLKKQNTLSDKLLAFLLLMLCIRVGKSVALYFNRDLAQVFLQVGMSACFLIGPLLYFYVQSKLGKLQSQTVDWRLHLGCLVSFVIIFGYIIPFNEAPELWKNLYWFIYTFWAVYLLASSFHLRYLFIQSWSKTTKWSDDDFWLFNIYIGNMLIFISYISFEYTSYIAGALTFTFIFYLNLLLFITQRFNKNREKYKNKELLIKDVEDLDEKIKSLMATEIPYKNANLTMPDLAKELKISPQKLSQFLNDNLEKSFSVFINEYRIDLAKRVLLSGKRITMEVLSEMCGYNSTSTFYSAFKKNTGMTPATFRKQNITIKS